MSGLTTSNPDNANPTVHKTGAEASSSRSRTRLADFLDVDEEEQLEEDTDDVNHGLTYSEDEEGGAAGSSNSDSGTEDIELIDSQEIFGGSVLSTFELMSKSSFRHLCDQSTIPPSRPHSFYNRPRTSFDIRTTSSSICSTM